MHWVTPKWQLTPDQLEHIVLACPRLNKARLTLTLTAPAPSLYSDDDSDDSDQLQLDEDPIKSPTPSQLLPPSRLLCGETFQTQIRFQESVILKKHFSPRIQQLALEHQVQIHVLPSKIKILGRSPASVAEAHEGIFALRNSIVVKSILRDGAAISFSERIQRTLSKVGVTLFEMMGKYFYWYKDGTKGVSQVVQEVFCTSRCFAFPLAQFHGQTSYDDHFPSAYLRVREMLLSTLFLNQFAPSLNQDERESRHVELCKGHLIIHCDKEAHVKIQQERLNQIFSQYGIFFILLPEQTPPFVDPRLILASLPYNRHLLLGVCYPRKELSIVKEFVKGVFAVEKKFQMGVLRRDKIEEKYVVHMDGCQLLSPRLKRLQNYLQILQKYVLIDKKNKPKLEEHYKEIKDVSVGDVSALPNNTTLNGSLNTSLANTSLDYSKANHASFLHELTHKEKKTKDFLTKYNAFIREPFPLEKYVEAPTVTKDELPQANQEVKEQVKALSKSLINIYKVKVPVKYQYCPKEGPISLAMASPPFEQERTQVQLLGPSLMGRGWIINVEKQALQHENGDIFVKRGQYELIRAFKII